jgi:methenyltetrahydrofolate cyclohydrolase
MDDDLSGFLKVLNPLNTSTGGGTASAVAGAMAAALVSMVARLSNNDPAAPGSPSCDEIAAEGTGLSAVLMMGSREDAEAFDAVRAALRKPKQTEEEKRARGEAIRGAWLQAARVPLRNAQSCARVLMLARLLEGRSNPSAASDLDCAGYLARAGLLGCAANVRINLRSIKDEDATAALAGRLAEILASAGE